MSKAELLTAMGLGSAIDITDSQKNVMDAFLKRFKDGGSYNRSALIFTKAPIGCARYFVDSVLDDMIVFNKTLAVKDSSDKYKSIHVTQPQEITRLCSGFNLTEADRMLKASLFAFTVLVMIRPEYIFGGTRLARSMFMEVLTQRHETGKGTVIFSGDSKNRILNLAQEQSEPLISTINSEGFTVIGG